MSRLEKNIKIKFFLKFFFVFLFISAWIFSGFPLGVQKAQAAQISFVNSSSNKSATTSVSINKPTNTADGDIMIAFVTAFRATNATAGVVTAPSGWNTINARAISTRYQVGIFWKRASSEGSSYSFTSSSATQMQGAIGSYRNCLSSGTPYEVLSNTLYSTSNTTVQAASMNTTYNGGAIIWAGWYYLSGTISLSAPSGMNDRTSQMNTNNALRFADLVNTSAQTTGVKNGTAGAACTVKHAYMVGLIPSIDPPTVTTQAAGNVEATTATGNGTIEATGGQNASAWGVCYKTSSGCTTADSVAAGSGTGGAGAFTASMASLSPGTTYYIKAYATNSAGTSYGGEVTILTKPAAPTNVAATDGTYNDKVTITWTKSTGATDYHVWRDSTDLGSAGDVATFDDTGTGAPSITAGSSVASDGTSSTQVDLSLSGTTFNNGTSHTYKVVASNATGNSVDSATNAGYRGIVNSSYQWQRSAGDSNGSYSDISGATSATYADTDAPADGSGRYYQCLLNATGVAQQISAYDRGFKGVISITLEPGSGTVTYGMVGASQNTTSSGVNQTQTVRNTGNVAEDFDIKGQSSADWALGASAGDAIYKHEWCTSNCDSSPTWNAMTTTYDSYYLVSNISANSTQDFDLKVTIPTLNPGTNQQNVDVFIRATQH